jgi:hypothetical protein
MSAERDIGGGLNGPEREFYKSLTIGLLAFLVTFVLLRWVWF